MEDDTAFVAGAGREKARLLLDTTEGLGLPRDSVQVTDGGFLVPVQVADYLNAPKEKKVAVAPKPKAVKKEGPAPVEPEPEVPTEDQEEK